MPKFSRPLFPEGPDNPPHLAVAAPETLNTKITDKIADLSAASVMVVARVLPEKLIPLTLIRYSLSRVSDGIFGILLPLSINVTRRESESARMCRDGLTSEWSRGSFGWALITDGQSGFPSHATSFRGLSHLLRCIEIYTRFSSGGEFFARGKVFPAAGKFNLLSFREHRNVTFLFHSNAFPYLIFTGERWRTWCSVIADEKRAQNAIP